MSSGSYVSFWHRKNWYNDVDKCNHTLYLFYSLLTNLQICTAILPGPRYHADTIRIAGCFHIGCTDAIPSLASTFMINGETVKQHISEHHTSVQAVSKPKLVSTIMRSLSTVQGTATLVLDGEFFSGKKLSEIAMMIDKLQMTIQYTKESLDYILYIYIYMCK